MAMGIAHIPSHYIIAASTNVIFSAFGLAQTGLTQTVLKQNKDITPWTLNMAAACAEKEKIEKAEKVGQTIQYKNYNRPGHDGGDCLAPCSPARRSARPGVK